MMNTEHVQLLPRRVDGHVHIFNPELAPDEFSVGQRFGLSRTEFQIFQQVYRLARRIDLPDPADEIAGVVNQVLEAIPATSRRWKGVKELLRLYFLSTRKAVLELNDLLGRNNVSEACLLVVDGPHLPRRAVERLLSEIAGCSAAHARLRVFIPIRFWRLGVRADGIKDYPAMTPEDCFGNHLDAPIDEHVPRIVHCSPAGIRRQGMTAAQARSWNAPWRWIDDLANRQTHICLAHGGGCGAFMNWHLNGQYKGGLNWSIDNMLRDTMPGMAELPGRLWVDCGFHEDMFQADYATAVARMQAWWNVLPGTDYPLHLPYYPYDRAVSRVNELFPDGAAQLNRFLWRTACH